MTAPASPVLAWLPLFAAFALTPFALLAGRLAGRPEAFRLFGPQGLALWTILAGLALFVGLGRSAQERIRQGRPAWPSAALGLVLALTALALLRAFGPALAQAQHLAPFLDEAKLPALVLFAGLWVSGFGGVPQNALKRLGAGLGALMTLDFLLTAIMAKRLTLGGAYLLPPGPAGSGALAFLLAIALAATLDRPDSTPGSDTGDTGKARPDLARWLILAGILTSFSRPALAAAACICLLPQRSGPSERLGLASACILCIWMSLTLPLAQPDAFSGGEELNLAWYYSAVQEALAQEPRALALGLSLSEPLALAMPDTPGLIWDAEFAGMPVRVCDIPVSSLRLLAGWGLAGPLLALAGTVLCALRGLRKGQRLGLGLTAAVLAGSALAPVLHTPVTALALALTLASAWRGDSPGPEPGPRGQEA